MTPAPARYRAAAPATLIIRPLDSLTALYHRASGQTHLLAPPAPEIVAILGEGAMDGDTLLAALAQRYELADPDPLALVARLDELIAAGLVERLPEAE